MDNERLLDYAREQILSILAKADKEILEMMEQLPDEALLRLARYDKEVIGNVFEQALPRYVHGVLVSRKPKLWRAATSNLQKEDLGKVKNLFYSIYLLVAEEA